MTNNFVLTRFLREKRLSNAQGRGLCEANAGHAPRAMVSWGRGIVGDAIKSWCDRPDDRFWSVSHIRRRYTKPVFIGFPLQLYGYQTVTEDLYLHAYPGGYPGIERLKFLCRIIENRLTQGGMWSPASKFGFCWNSAHEENVFHHSTTLVIGRDTGMRRPEAVNNKRAYFWKKIRIRIYIRYVLF